MILEEGKPNLKQLCFTLKKKKKKKKELLWHSACGKGVG